ncbi:YolD-like family protein [Lysinibacillus parviboronicapiens]|uniref:YolD-like family protein n=2 Tax=Lysinibacillus parviboronicapiens TaxID=436516 RepID=UPI001FD00716|nr:YolD-like family protein [Lysinibacillus parviboronicapiens]
MMMLNDRGTMKWTAMMLPEHLVQIKEWKQEQFYEKKRDLVEWELEELQRTIQRVTVMKKLVTLTLWDNNQLHDETGLITGTDINKKELLLETETAIKRITFDKIQNAELVDADD